MKVLNEKEKKMRQIAMMNLNVGNKMEKEAARKFLKDIGLSDDAIENIEGKKKKKVEEAWSGPATSWKFVKDLPDGMIEIKANTGDIGYVHKNKVSIDKNGIVTFNNNTATKIENIHKVEESSLNEDHIFRNVTSLGAAQNILKNKRIFFNKIDKEDINSVFAFIKDGKKFKIGHYNPISKELIITDMKLRESLNEECNCNACAEEKYSKCEKSTKKKKEVVKEEIDENKIKRIKETLRKDLSKNPNFSKSDIEKIIKDTIYSLKKNINEEEIKDKINTVDAAQGALKAKKINWTKTEKIGNKTVFKNGDAIVGAWDPSWGTVRTGEDLIK